MPSSTVTTMWSHEARNCYTRGILQAWPFPNFLGGAWRQAKICSPYLVPRPHLENREKAILKVKAIDNTTKTTQHSTPPPSQVRSENSPVPELTYKTVDGTDPSFTAAFSDPMLPEIHSAYGVSQVSQDQKLLEVKKHSPPTPAPKPHINQKLQKAKKQPVHPSLTKKPSPPTPPPKPQDHQKLQASNSVDAMQIPRRKTKHKGRWGER